MTTAETAWAEAMTFENRPDPYPFFDELRKTPVVHVGDGVYVVTGYRELWRWPTTRGSAPTCAASPISARRRRCADVGAETGGVRREPNMIMSDPPEHDRAAPPGDAALRPAALAGPHSRYGADIQTLCNESLDKIKAKGGTGSTSSTITPIRCRWR